MFTESLQTVIWRLKKRVYALIIKGKHHGGAFSEAKGRDKNGRERTPWLKTKS